MRIPPSAIVMTLLCGVPFGLAIRDSRRADKHAAHHEDEDLDDLDSMHSSAAYERQHAMEEAERREREEAVNLERSGVAKQIVGSEPAMMGTMFDGVALGAPAGTFQPESVRSEIAKHSDVLSVDWDVGQSRLDGALVTLLGDDCEPLIRAVGRWGAGVDSRWSNASMHQRAELDRAACSLKFERYVDVDAWIDRRDTAIVPLGAIGMSADKLHDRVQPLITADLDTDDSFSWTDVGLAGAMGKTELTAFKKNHKIVALTVLFHTDSAGIDALEARLTKLLGSKPAPSSGDEDLGGVTWKGRVPVTFTTGDVASLTIGTIPE
jgi:hypothetical protein